MTTVVALHTPGKGTIIASDTQLSMPSGLVHYYPKGKVLSGGGWAVGVCGAFKTMTLLHRHADELFERVDDVHDVTDRIADMTKQYGFSTSIEESGVPTHDNSLLVANADGVWDVDGSFAERPVNSGELAAVGSGAVFALGSANTTRDWRNPLKRVVAAMEAAFCYDRGTGGTIVITELRARRTRA